MRKSAELRKAEIVATVLDLADRIGPDRVTTGAVASQIGVTQAALFRHFPTKADLLDEVAARWLQDWARVMDRRLSATAHDALAELRRVRDGPRRRRRALLLVLGVVGLGKIWFVVPDIRLAQGDVKRLKHYRFPSLSNTLRVRVPLGFFRRDRQTLSPIRHFQHYIH